MSALRLPFRPTLVKLVRGYLRRSGKIIVHSMPQIGRPRRLDVFDTVQTNDHVRLSALELCAHEIITRNVSGSIAEVGVYQGEFAAQMHGLFSDRKFYLFDTFDGFDSKQVTADREKYGLDHDRDFSNTSIESVLSKMKHPNRCVVKKGLFPATADDVEDVFCFVSLDADLFDPIYDGLRWFWPRLSKGGYIFVHDYNNARFPGAAAAISRFAEENSLPFFPLPDVWGSAVFSR